MNTLSLVGTAQADVYHSEPACNDGLDGEDGQARAGRGVIIFDRTMA